LTTALASCLHIVDYVNSPPSSQKNRGLRRCRPEREQQREAAPARWATYSGRRFAPSSPSVNMTSPSAVVIREKSLVKTEKEKKIQGGFYFI
jgi:hypothetical protein